jgi:hypothetical protein
MGDSLFIQDVSLTQIRYYYLIVFLSFIYLLYKFRKTTFSIFIIVLFYNGLFSFISKDIQNFYKITLTLISFYYLVNKRYINSTQRIKFVFISFIFFSIVFFYSSYLNNDYFFIIFSQYSRYFVLFSLFLILYRNQGDENFKQRIENVLYPILLVQIGLTIVKFVIMGLTESIVGSIGSQGGALATSLPIMAFIFLWMKRNGRLQSKDWGIILGFLFIGFVSSKRAIWFVMPIIVALFMFYIPKRRIPPKSLLFALLAVPLIFYLGVRFNSSLNKEGVVGGSYDTKFAVDYAQDYMFGDEGSKKAGTGRGGATIMLFDKFQMSNLNQKDWFGYGLRYMYATDYDEFQELDFGISTKGAATGVFQSYVSNGYIGILVSLLFALSMLIKTRNKRLKYVIIAFFCWEYFFYTGIIIREYSLSFLLIFIIIFSKKDLIFLDDHILHNNLPINSQPNFS